MALGRESHCLVRMEFSRLDARLRLRPYLLMAFVGVAGVSRERRGLRLRGLIQY